eukprot:COSAG02_NODE_1450_length_12560_cov_3.240109_2_plen_91_part_00
MERTVPRSQGRGRQSNMMPRQLRRWHRSASFAEHSYQKVISCVRPPRSLAVQMTSCRAQRLSSANLVVNCLAKLVPFAAIVAWLATHAQR